MSDDLLRYYNSELQHLRRMGDQFARANPQIAANLRVGSEGEYDPYVGRLVEAFAFLNARTRLKLEDGFPEIAGTYLDVIYPHFQRPFPSSMIAQFALDLGQAELFDGYQLPRGTLLRTPRVDGFSCQFRTAYDTVCWPFEVRSCGLQGLPFRAPRMNLSRIAQGLLKIELATQAEHVEFHQFQAKSLRFYIHLPAPYSYQLYEALFNDAIGLAITAGPDDERPTILPIECLKPVGFAEDEGLVDYPPQSFLGYRLLSEYFAFPEKFCFFDVTLPPGSLPASTGMEVNVLFGKRWEELETAVTKKTFRLGCAPVVNLFTKRLEPVRVTQYQTDYPLVVDSQRREYFEIFSVDRVVGVTDAREQVTYQPFYSINHADAISRYFWIASRIDSERTDDLGRGTDMSLALVDLQFNPAADANWNSVVQIDATCSNRNLPSRLPIVPEQTSLELEAPGPIDSCLSLNKPSACFRPPMGAERRWRLVSQLSLNHLSFTDQVQGGAALREVLSLYSFHNTESSRSRIDGILGLTTKRTVGRLPGDNTGALCRGTEILLQFDESKYTAGNMFLFASVLESFLALFSNINSFTRVVAASNKRSGEFHRWPARSGYQHVL